MQREDIESDRYSELYDEMGRISIGDGNKLLFQADGASVAGQSTCQGFKLPHCARRKYVTQNIGERHDLHGSIIHATFEFDLVPSLGSANDCTVAI